MAAQRVIGRSPPEVSIDGKYYRLTRAPQTTLASQFPAKVTIGDTTGDSQQRLSTIRWSDARGGIGKKDHEGAVDVQRLWYGTSHLRVNGHRTLPDRVTTTSASGVSGVIKVGAMAELASAIYAAFGTSVRKYTFSTDSWGAELHALPAIATDAITVRLGGTVYMVFAHTGGATYTTDGSSFTDITDDMVHITEWDERIWGIDDTGQLRWAFDPSGTWTNDAQLPLENSTARDLFVGRDAHGNHILYASTRVGLFAHDAANNRFVRTGLKLPFHADSGQGVVVWRDSVYIPAGLGIYKYNVGAQATTTIHGPDRDQGLPANRRGKIIGLDETHNDLIARIDSTSASAEVMNTHISAGLASHQSPAMNPKDGISTVLGWNEVGWQVLFESEAQTEAMSASLVSNAYDGYRFWFAHNRRVKYFSLPVDVVNPAELTNRVYADASRDEFPWFDAGQAEVDKLAVRVKVEVADTSTTETVTPYFALNYDDNTWTALSAIASDGISTYHFPNTTAEAKTAAPVGSEFQSIRFRTDLANGSDNSLSPDVRSITLEYRKKVAARFGWSFELNLYENWRGRHPKTQRADLLSAISSNTLVEVTFRDDAGDTRNFWADIIQLTGLEETGHDERGITRLVVAEP